MATDKQYVLGKGRVYIDLLDANKNSKEGERFVGNAPAFTSSYSENTLDHYASTGGIKTKDLSVTLDQTRNGSFTIDNIDKKNIALFFMGTATKVTQVSATGATETIALTKGNTVQLGKTPSNPTGVRNVSNLLVKTTGGSPVTLPATNYTFDAVRGLLTINNDAAIAADGTPYALTYDVAASSRDQIISSNNSIYAALRFVADNPVGENRDYYMPYVKISPNGDYALIGDDWQAMQFNFEALVKDSNTAQFYIDGQASAS